MCDQRARVRDPSGPDSDAKTTAHHSIHSGPWVMAVQMARAAPTTCRMVNGHITAAWPKRSITWNGNTAFFVPEPVVVDPTPTPEPSVSGEPTPEPSVSGEPTPEPSVSGEPTPTPEPSVSAEPTPVAPPATAIAGDADFAG